MSKFKERKESITTFLQDRRKTALIKLVGFIIFFIFVFITLSINSTPQSNNEKPNTLTTLDQFKEYSRFKALITVNSKEDIDEYLIITEYKDEEEVVYLINDNYFLIDTTGLYQLDITTKEKTLINYNDIFNVLNINILNPKNLVTYIEKGTIEYKADYTNEQIKTSYLIPINFLIKDFYEEEIDNNNLTNVNIIITEKDNKVLKVELNIIELIKLKYNNYESYNIVIEYEDYTELLIEN